MKNLFNTEYNTFCTLHWWNGGKKTLSFKGNLIDLLKEQKVNFKIKKAETEGIFNYTFKNSFGITFKAKGVRQDFAFYSKQFLQMELCRMGDKATLYVQGVWRSTVTINH